MFKDFSPGKIYRNKVFIGAVCIIVALAIGFVALPRYNAKTRQTVKVWQAAQTIYEYQTITKDMLRAVDVGSYGLSGQVIKSSNSIIGKTAKTKIVQGDNIMTSQLTGGDSKQAILSELSNEGKLAASVTLPNLTSSVAGNIKSGDIVSVITFKQVPDSKTSSGTSSAFNNGISGNTTAADINGKEAIAYPQLKYLRVAAITNKDGQSLDGSVSQSSGSNDIPYTVTFACNEKQADMLAEIEKKSDVYLVFVARGAQAEKILKQQSATSSSSAASK